jgi:hypothetical protein
MSLLDSIVGAAFRDEKAGRVVVFSGDRRNRGYIVRSAAEEIKIRSFLKMFYFAHFSILLLGMLVANAWSTFFINIQSMGSPAAHLLRSEGIYLCVYSVVVLLPYFLLWRSYKKALLGFVSAQDEVLVSGKNAKGRPWFVLAGLSALLALLLCGIGFYLIQGK